jgi:ABC-type antimicrobial peptide transport system permease subunit
LVQFFSYYRSIRKCDYFSLTYDLFFPFNPSDPLINFESWVVGLRTNSSGKLKDDSYFGQHQIFNKSNDYTGSNMEELLNTTDMVCVVDETFVNYMKVNNSAFGINSTISIFPQQFQDNRDTIPTTSLWTNITATNGTITGGTVDDLTLPFPFDLNVMTITSNKTSLEVIIDFNMTLLMMHYINPYNVSIKSFVNTSVEQLELEVLNHYTGTYNKLGDINSTDDMTRIFTFNQYMPPFSYINQSNMLMRFRITGQNSTYDSDFGLNIDMLSLLVDNSTYSMNASTWPSYKVIGIIKDPKLYNTERVNWLAGTETYSDVMGTENAVYINYELARQYVYPMNNGSLINGTNDKVTSVLIHCNNIEEIETNYNQLKQELNDVESGVWTAVDFKTPTLDSRRYANDWYIWIEEGKVDEDVLEELIEYIEDKGYVVFFGFTRTFVEDMFRGMIDLITTITTGILVFAIIIAMIGLALHSLLSTMARRREIGMLRSIGLSKKGVIRTVSGETIVISLLGAFIGIFAGLLQGFLMVSAVPAGSMLAVTFAIPWLTIGILLSVTIATAILSSRYPSRWAANINIIDAVRTR